MPRVNIPKLVEILIKHQMRLYDIFMLSKNNELSDAIQSERDTIIALIKTLEEYLEDERLQPIR